MTTPPSTSITRMTVLGHQLALDLYDCPPELLNDREVVENALVHAARAINATIVETAFHLFSPQGVSGVVVIKESHIAVHTWPEYGYAAVDIFTCGDMNMDAAVDAVSTALKSGHHTVKRLERGLLPPV